MEALYAILIAAAIFGCGIFLGRQWAVIREGDRIIADLYQLGGAYLAGRKHSAGADKKAPKCAESYYLGYEHGARDAVAAGALAALKKK